MTTKLVSVKTAAADLHSVTAALADPFGTDEVRFKPQSVKGNKALALAYVDARAIQDRLDDVLGAEGWQDEYECLPDGSVVCRLRLKLGGEWITKMDVGSPSEQPDGGDRLKAAFSDALKRAAVKFGIGRYLYRLPAQWADYDPQRRQFTRPPQLPAFARPKVAEPAPPKLALPPAAKAETSKLPADGAELLRRLQDYEAKLAGQGVCKKGELLKHVTAAGDRAGYGTDLSQWGREAIALAAREAKAFEGELRIAPAGRKAVA